MSAQTRAQLITLMNSKILSGGNQTTAKMLRDFNTDLIQAVVNLIDDKDQNGGYLGINSVGIADASKIKSATPVGNFLRDDGTWQTNTSYGATNGLAIISGSYGLGGSLIQDTIITGASNLYGILYNQLKSFAVDAGTGTTVSGNLTVDNTQTSLVWRKTNGYIAKVENNATYSGITAGLNANVASILAYLTVQTIANNGTNNALIINDLISSKGLVYTADYSANFTFESLVSKRFTDNTYLSLIGGTLSGFLTLNADPTNPLHPASKNYVDLLINGIDWKKSARASTTAALPTYVVSGGNTILTASANGALASQDGIALVVNDRLLVKNEAGALQVNNGGYTVTSLGSVSTPWVLTRTADANTSTTLLKATWNVREGATEANRAYSVNVSPITMGTTNITLALINGAGTYVNGTGLNLTGNVFSLNNTFFSGDATVNGSGVVAIGATKVTNTMLAGSISDSNILSATTWNAKVSLTGAETLTNKRITARVTTIASSATPTPNADTDDTFVITAQAAAATFAAPTGMPTQGQKLTIRVKDNATAQTLAYNVIYRAIGVTLPTTTVISKTLYLGAIYNSTDTKWDVVAISQE